MENLFDVVALGEILIDFTPVGYLSSNMRYLFLESKCGHTKTNSIHTYGLTMR